MDHAKIPNLTAAEREAVAAYREAHLLHAGMAMEEIFGDETEGRLRRAILQRSGRFSCLGAPAHVSNRIVK